MSDATGSTTEPKTYATWDAVFMFLDTPTSDGRVFASEGMKVRQLPLTLSAMTESGHDQDPQSVPAGKINALPVVGKVVNATGDWDSTPEAQEAARKVDEQILRGISADLTIQRYTQRFPLDMTEEIVQDPEGEYVQIEEATSDYLFEALEWEVGGGTVVDLPGFADALIQVTASADQTTATVVGVMTRVNGEPIPGALEIVASAMEAVGAVDPDESEESGPFGMLAFYPSPDEATALADDPGDTAPEEMHLTLAVFKEDPGDALDALLTDFASTHPALAGDVTGIAAFSPGPDGTPIVALADVLGLAELRTELVEALSVAAIPYAEDHDFVPHLTLQYSTAPVVDPADPALGLPLTFGAITYAIMGGDSTEYALTGTTETEEGEEVTASAAGLAPLHPPVEWFENPTLDTPTTIHVTEDGRLFGHAALWGVCHTGIKGQCLMVDRLRSQTEYAYFHSGHVVTEEGVEVRTGTVTMDTGHAKLGSKPSDVVAHYDNTGTAVADVRLGEDEFGLWVSGAIRPDLPAAKVRAIRAATLSGDWRPVNGRTELLRVLAVNTGGFPIVDPAVVASGALDDDSLPLEAVAAGVLLPGVSYRVVRDPEAELRILGARAGGLDGMREFARSR